MSYIPELYDFLGQLALNNNRPWFAAHRAEYDRLRELWLADLDRLIAEMCRWCPQLAHQTARSAVYRIYRDTRFSPDKTPFKTYFSAVISPYGRKSDHAGFYIQIGVDQHQSGLYGGLWCPQAPVLAKLRHAIVDNIEEFTAITDAPELEREFPGWLGDKLKTIPKGWEKDHPQAEFLRLKEYGRFHPCTPEFFADPDWYIHASELFRILAPLVDFLNYSIDE